MRTIKRFLQINNNLGASAPFKPTPMNPADINSIMDHFKPQTNEKSESANALQRLEQILETLERDIDYFDGEGAELQEIFTYIRDQYRTLYNKVY